MSKSHIVGNLLSVFSLPTGWYGVCEIEFSHTGIYIARKCVPDSQTYCLRPTERKVCILHPKLPMLTKRYIPKARIFLLVDLQTLLL